MTNVLTTETEQELLNIVDAVYAGVSDQMRQNSPDMLPTTVTSVPILYGTIQRMQAALKKAGRL